MKSFQYHIRIKRSDPLW